MTGDCFWAHITGSCLQGQIRLRRQCGGTVAEISLHTADRSADVCRICLLMPGGNLDLPLLPLWAGTGKMTYLEGRLANRDPDGAQIRVYSGCGYEMGRGILRRRDRRERGDFAPCMPEERDCRERPYPPCCGHEIPRKRPYPPCCGQEMPRKPARKYPMPFPGPAPHGSIRGFGR